MSGLQNTTEQFKDNGAGPLSTAHTPATITPLPTARSKKRDSFFSREIWSAERKPSFARSSIYGYAR